VSTYIKGIHIKRGMFSVMWEVRYLPQAEDERGNLPGKERQALDNAIAKLEAIGPNLGYPHTSHVQQADDLRELRPRAGNSPWRALYRKVDDAFVIAAICPEAQKDSRRFQRGCDEAAKRLAELEEDEQEAEVEHEEEE
jgi:hypothetical protein